MEFSPVRRVNAYEQIVEQIEQAVISGELQVGDRLPGERKLVETFSVSRSTVREAMRVLHATGLVDSRPGDPRGPVVMPFTAEVLDGPLQRMASQAGTTRVELLQFRFIIDGEAALLAAAHHDDEAIAEIARVTDEIHRLLESGQVGPEAFGPWLKRFHQAIRAAAKNRLIEVSGAALSDALTHIAQSRLNEPGDRQRVVQQSAKDAGRLLEAIRQGDPTESRRLMTGNIFRYYEQVLTDEEQTALKPLIG